jgi:hypothetical protein
VLWPSHASGCPSLSTVQACIRPDVSATRPNALQSSRRILRSSASVRTTWQYHLVANQCSIRKRISFADIDMGRQLQPPGRQVYIVRTLSLIRQDMEKNYNRLDASPYYGNYMQLKCNRSDDRCNDPPPMTQYCPLLVPQTRLHRR